MPFRGQRLFEGGVYSARRTSTVSHYAPMQRSCELCPRPLALSPARAMADFELEFARGHHVHLATHLRMRIATVYMNAATVQGRPLLRLARVLCGAYSRAAFIRGAAFIQGKYGIHG